MKRYKRLFTEADNSSLIKFIAEFKQLFTSSLERKGYTDIEYKATAKNVFNLPNNKSFEEMSFIVRGMKSDKKKKITKVTFNIPSGSYTQQATFSPHYHSFSVNDSDLNKISRLYDAWSSKNLNSFIK